MRSSLRSALPVAALAALALAAPAAAAAAPIASVSANCAGADAEIGQLTHTKAARATLCLINKERTTNRRRPLKPNTRLARASRAHSSVMVAHRVFAHETRFDGSVGDRARRAGYLRGARRWIVGENIGYGTGRLATPRSMVIAWMKSSGHRANILDRRYREIGIAIDARTPTPERAAGGTYTTTFGARG